MGLRLISLMSVLARHVPQYRRHLGEKWALKRCVAVSGFSILKFLSKLFDLLGHELVLQLEMLHLLHDLRVACGTVTLLVII
jgi:hypothetical protein